MKHAAKCVVVYVFGLPLMNARGRTLRANATTAKTRNMSPMPMRAPMDRLRPTLYPNPTLAPNGTCLSTKDRCKEEISSCRQGPFPGGGDNVSQAYLRAVRDASAVVEVLRPGVVRGLGGVGGKRQVPVRDETGGQEDVDMKQEPPTQRKSRLWTYHSQLSTGYLVTCFSWGSVPLRTDEEREE